MQTESDSWKPYTQPGAASILAHDRKIATIPRIATLARWASWGHRATVWGAAPAGNQECRTRTSPIDLALRPDSTKQAQLGAASLSADVVGVGGGLAGLRTATSCAADGASVVVIEAATVAARTTGHSTAKLTALRAGSDVDQRHAFSADRRRRAGVGRRFRTPPSTWRQPWRYTGDEIETSPSGQCERQRSALAADRGTTSGRPLSGRPLIRFNAPRD